MGQNQQLVLRGMKRVGSSSKDLNIWQICLIEALSMGAIEFFRNSELDPIKRIYPGQSFDPLGFASPGKSDIRQIERLRESEIRHSRLAMISFLGFVVQSLFVNEGALNSLAKFSSGI